MSSISGLSDSNGGVSFPNQPASPKNPDPVLPEPPGGLLPLNHPFVQAFQKMYEKNGMVFKTHEIQVAATHWINSVTQMFGDQLRALTEHAKERMKEDWKNVNES